MLSFDSSLSDSLKLGITCAFWVLKLYYEDESATNFIGLSDTHRVDGSDIYYGIVRSWGSLNQSLDLFNFSVSTASLTVSLINAENSIQGQRFSDLFSSNNFANRKWELFLNTNSAGTYDTSARMIGTGIISGDIKYDYKKVDVVLIDKSDSIHNELPKNRVDASTYTNAPEENLNKPIPIWYGDFRPLGVSGDAGSTIGNGSAGNIDHYFTKGKAPSIVTDIWSASAGAIISKPDSVVLNDLSNDNVYMYKNGYYIVCNNGSTSTSSHTASVSGSSWSVFLPFVLDSNTSSPMSDWANTVDGDLETFGRLTHSGSGGEVLGKWRWARYSSNDFGTVSTTKVIIFYKNFNDNSNNDVTTFAIRRAGAATSNLKFHFDQASGANEEYDSYAELVTLASVWGADGIQVELVLNADAAKYVEIRTLGTELTFEPNQNTFTKEEVDYHEVPVVSTRNPEFPHKFENMGGGEGLNLTRKVARTKSITTPDVGQYIYVAGKGREYGAWIDTINSAVRTDSNGNEPDPGFNSGDLIENPVYIIEDIFRTELGLDSSTTGADIDVESFDKAGNHSSGGSAALRGDISFALNDTVTDIKYAFSQYKFINSRDLIAKISKQCMSFVWFSGSGKFKIKSLILPDQTFVADSTIDFRDIIFKNISKTPLNNVRNKIIVNYAYDYARDKFTKQTTHTADSTSVGDGTSGYRQTLKLEIDADCINDKTTAENLRDAYLNQFKDRKIVLEFDLPTVRHNDLEVTDYIQFTNWDSNLKLYGTAYNDDYFIISSISKNVNGCSIKAIKVDS